MRILPAKIKIQAQKEQLKNALFTFPSSLPRVEGVNPGSNTSGRVVFSQFDRNNDIDPVVKPTTVFTGLKGTECQTEEQDHTDDEDIISN